MKDQLWISTLVLCSSLLLISMLLQRWRKPKTRTTQNLPPGPWKLPIVGNIHQLLGSDLPHHRLSELANKYGDIMHLQVGEISNIIISSPLMAKEVMKTHDHSFAQRPYLLAADIFLRGSDIAFSPSGPYWRQLRKICVLELLSPQRVRSFRSVREVEVSNLISLISSSAGKPVNVSMLLSALTFGLVSRACFGKKCKDEEALIKIIEEFTEDLAGFSLFDLFPSVKFLGTITGLRPRLMRLTREADRILANIMDDHQAIEEDGSLLGVLLKLKDNGNLEFPLTIENVKAVMLDLLIAGGDTTPATVIWVLAEMLKNPRVMEKAQTEVREVFKDKKNVDETSLPDLKYLKMVIKEGMRLHPAGPLLLPRECGESIEINGYNIPRSAKVIVNAWRIQRDPDYWTEPDTFFPERFLDSPIDFSAGTNFEFISFGAGRRMCPGSSFATAIIELALAQLLFHFDWKVPTERQAETLDMTELYGATVRKKYDLCLLPSPYASSNHCHVD